MDLPSDVAVATYVVACFGCRQPFEAFEAIWCDVWSAGGRSPARTVAAASARRLDPSSRGSGKRHRAASGTWPPRSTPTEELPENPDVASVKHPLVLVVDDEKDILRIAFAAILRLGYHTIVASDGEEGIAMAVKYKPDLILTDAFMPKLDGREMCRRIKIDPQTSAAKVVVMTSLYTASRHKYEAYKEFRADDFLAKPLEFRALEELLRKHLSPEV